MTMTIARLSALSLALAAALAFMIDVADARVGGGAGSRGSRTYTPPPTTNTAPTPATPIERSMVQPSAAQQVKAPAPAASRFGSGFGGLLLGGLLGAGLFGLLSGNGLFGGLTGFASFLGLLLQVALIAGAAYLIIGYFRSRNQPALARASLGGSHSGSEKLNGVPAGGAAYSPVSTLLISSADYDAFERLLGNIQTAYGREDVESLGNMTTSEMLSYFSQDLAEDKRKGVRNEVSDVKLLQGDLSEAWQETGSDYATVAMRFSLIDVVVDRATGQVVSGNRAAPQQATEVWTFRRDRDRPAQSWQQGWQLSAIQHV